MQNHALHQSVLLNEALDQMNICPDGRYVDATFGRGGHSEAILARLNQAGKLLAIDQDWDAVDYGKNAFNDPRLTLVQGNFSQLQAILEQHELWHKVHGILFDLGVSSPQLDDAERGFSFMRDGPLDMRMDVKRGIPAKEWLARISEKQLSQALFDGGEERYARQVAKAIVTQRQQAEITTTKQLASLVSEVVKKRQPGKHPATLTFQAIRIAINQEIAILPTAFNAAIDSLVKTGRVCVISFHSTEDQVVKKVFRERSGQGTIPRGLPLRQSEISAQIKILGRRIKPSAAEIAANPRSRSATLRVAEKIQ